MITLQDVKKAVDQLSPEERAELQAYLAERENLMRDLSPEERIQRLDAAARAIREGFTDAEWAEIEQAMNAR